MCTDAGRRHRSIGWPANESMSAINLNLEPPCYSCPLISAEGLAGQRFQSGDRGDRGGARENEMGKAKFLQKINVWPR